jgi:hypothetical protein
MKTYRDDQVVSPEVFALVKKLEAVVVAKKFTIDGEVYVCKRGNVPFELPLEVEALGELPAELKARQVAAMDTIHSFVEELRRMSRAVPPLRNELKKRGVTKKDLELLERLGFLKSALIPLQAADGKRTKPVYCAYFTNQGRALVRERLCHAYYGRDGDVHWDSVRQEADNIRRRQAEQEAVLRKRNQGAEDLSGGF